MIPLFSSQHAMCLSAGLSKASSQRHSMIRGFLLYQTLHIMSCCSPSRTDDVTYAVCLQTSTALQSTKQHWSEYCCCAVRAMKAWWYLAATMGKTPLGIPGCSPFLTGPGTRSQLKASLFHLHLQLLQNTLGNMHHRLPWPHWQSCQKLTCQKVCCMSRVRTQGKQGQS